MKFYRANFGTYPLAISEKEKYVKKYAEDMRCLSLNASDDKSYTITEIDTTYNELMNDDLEGRLVQKMGKGLYLTYEDIYLLEKESSKFMSLYENTIKALGELIYFNSKIPSNAGLTEKFRDLKSVMVDYNSDFQRAKFTAAVQHNSPIFSESINEYIFYVTGANELNFTF